MPLGLRKRDSKPSRLHNLVAGQTGEHQAAEFLRQQGYRIIATNVRLGREEIDIVACDPAHQELVFVEVKTRLRASVGTATEAVDTRKLHALTRAGAAYIRQHHYRGDYRYDIIAICGQQIEHFTNITWP